MLMNNANNHITMSLKQLQNNAVVYWYDQAMKQATTAAYREHCKQVRNQEVNQQLAQEKGAELRKHLQQVNDEELKSLIEQAYDESIKQINIRFKVQSAREWLEKINDEELKELLDKASHKELVQRIEKTTNHNLIERLELESGEELPRSKEGFLQGILRRTQKQSQNIQAYIKNTLHQHDSTLSDEFLNQLSQKLLDQLAQVKQDKKLHEACDILGNSAVKVLAQETVDQLYEQTGHKKLDEDQVTEKMLDTACQNSLETVHEIADHYQLAQVNSLKLSYQSLTEQDRHDKHEDRFESASEGLETLESSSHSAEKWLEMTRHHATQKVAHTMGVLGAPLASLAFGIQAGGAIKKKMVDKKPLSREDKEGLGFSGVFTAFILGALFNPIGASVAGGLLVGAYVSSVAFSLYQYYREKWVYRKDVDNQVASLKEEITDKKDRLERLNDKLAEHLKNDESKIDLQKVKRLRGKIQKVNEEYNQTLDYYKPIKRAQNDIQKQRKQWYKPIRPARHALAGLVTLAGAIMSFFPPLMPIGIPMVGVGLAWGGLDSVLGDKLVDTGKKAAQSVASFVKHPGRSLNKAKDWVQQKVDNLRYGKSAQMKATASQQLEQSQQATLSQNEQVQAQQQQQENFQQKSQHKPKPGFWQKFKQRITSLFQSESMHEHQSNQQRKKTDPEQSSERSQSSQSTLVNHDESTAGHEIDNDTETHESTAALMSQLYEDKANFQTQKQKHIIELERRIDVKLGKMADNEDYAGILQFVKHAGEQTNKQLPSSSKQAISSLYSQDYQKERVRVYFAHFANSPAALSLLYQLVDPQNQAKLGDELDDIYDEIPDATLQAINDNPSVKKAVVETIAEANKLDKEQTKNFESKFDKLLTQGRNSEAVDDNQPDRQASLGTQAEVDRSSPVADPDDPDEEDEDSATGPSFFH